MAGAAILGLGACLPERVMENEEWTRWVDTSDQWIRERTGIERRRICGPDESSADLAEAAARAALADADCPIEEIDEIVVATDTPEADCPDTAAFLQHRLGARPVPTFDLAGSGCAGFLQALDLCCSRLATGRRRVLLIGVEAISRQMDWTCRDTCVLFGDAAAAVVLGRPQPNRPEVLAVTAGTDGSRAPILGRMIGGNRIPFSAEVLKQEHWSAVVMKGREVFKEAVTRMAEAGRAALELAGLSLDQVDLFVPHQANLRIIEATGKALGLPLDRVFVNVQEYGNTGSASVPLALWEARQAGRIPPGGIVLMTAFGAGFHWAGAVARF
ncbi:MAG: beta-ketoacyl-ACP synthase III [Planctomycetota bacterium]|nr:MAG: beta-ketoacyl-ACP synthase III [Planctomycetota bacterium]